MRGWFTANLVAAADPVTKKVQTMPDFKGVADPMAWVITANNDKKCLLVIAATQAILDKIETAGVKSWGNDSSDSNFVKILQDEAKKLGNPSWDKSKYFILDKN